MVQRAVMVAAALATGLAAGCASPGEYAAPAAEAQIPAGRYGAAFEAARETLVDLGFEMERIDARLGVITTKPKSSVGLAAPWDAVQSKPQQELEDLLNRQFRRATVVFQLPGAAEHAPARPQTMPGPEPEDLRLVDEAMVARVEVVLERLHRPGWRLEPTAMRFSLRSFDPDLRSTSMWPQYTVAFSQDPQLGLWLARKIEAAAAGE